MIGYRLRHYAATGMLVLSLLAMAQAGDSRQKTLNVYAWAEYFPPSVVRKFQAETGIHVNYAVFDSPDAAETALSAGSSNYDIVTMNAVPHLAREIPQGFWKKLDATQIPNARNADPQILKILEQVLHSADPERHFGVISGRGRGGRSYFGALSSISCRV